MALQSLLRATLSLPALLAALLALPVTRTLAASPPGPAAFGILPQVSHVALSPAGNMLASAGEARGQQKIFVTNLATMQALPGIAVGVDNKLRDLHWLDEQTLILTISKTELVPNSTRVKWELFRSMTVDIKTGAVHVLLPSAGAEGYVSATALVNFRTSKPDTIFMSSLSYNSSRERVQTGSHIQNTEKDSGWANSLFEVDARTGQGKRIETGTMFIDRWLVNAAGTPVAYSEWRGDKKHFGVFSHVGLVWREILHADGERPFVIGLSPDGKSVQVVGQLGGDRQRLWNVALDGSGPTELLAAPGADIIGYDTDIFTQAAISGTVSGMQRNVLWLDAASQARMEKLQHTFGGHEVTILSQSANHQRVVVEVQTGSLAPVCYFVDLAASRADTVGEEYPGLVGRTLGEVRTISYKARDGMEIPAYLTLPAGVSDARNLPMVVLPHGGPNSRDDDGFDYLSQYLSTLGYLVLRPQFRGSYGFGNAFMLAGYRQWGGLMQDDVTDGVRAMTQQGVADPKRVCVVGGSYGGYVALEGANSTPELYACAVSINGVTDLPDLLTYDAGGGYNASAVATLREHIGGALEPFVVAHSPARDASHIIAPVLLIHSTDDTVVPFAQAKKMADELQRTGKQFRLVQLPGDDHWLSNAATRTQMLQALGEFLQQKLPVQAP